MAHKNSGSKTPHTFQPAQLKRIPNNSFVNNFVEFQLTEQQAQHIQIKLPKAFRLINMNNGELERIKQENKTLSNKNIQPSSLKTDHVPEEKKVERKSQGKIRKRHNLINKKRQEAQSVQFHDSFVQKQQKNKKDVILKKKNGAKQNNETKNENLAHQLSFEQKPDKQIHVQKILPADFLPQSGPSKTNIFVRQSSSLKNSYIRLLPNGEPRYVPLPTDHQFGGSMQTNSLRYLYGIPFSMPVDEPVTKLNQKQKNFCINIVQRLKLHQSSQPFRIAVNPQGQKVPDYYHVVYSPMDLHTIYRKVTKDKYRQIYQFHNDVNRIILNSYKYNLRDTIYFQTTVQFQDYYQQLLQYAFKNPQEFAKKYVPKYLKKKVVDDLGQLDFTQKTPVKQKKRGLNQSLKASSVLGRPPQGQKKGRGKVKGNNDDINVSNVVSDMYNEFVVDNTDNQQELDESFREKKLTKLKKLHLHRTQSLPQDRDEAQIFEQSLQFHNTQSNNSTIIKQNHNKIPKQNSQYGGGDSKKTKQIIKQRRHISKPKLPKNSQDNQNYQPEIGYVKEATIVPSRIKEREQERQLEKQRLERQQRLEKQEKIRQQKLEKHQRHDRKQQEYKNVYNDDYNDFDQHEHEDGLNYDILQVEPMLNQQFPVTAHFPTQVEQVPKSVAPESIEPMQDAVYSEHIKVETVNETKPRDTHRQHHVAKASHMINQSAAEDKYQQYLPHTKRKIRPSVPKVAGSQQPVPMYRKSRKSLQKQQSIPSTSPVPNFTQQQPASISFMSNSSTPHLYTHHHHHHHHQLHHVTTNNINNSTVSSNIQSQPQSSSKQISMYVTTKNAQPPNKKIPQTEQNKILYGGTWNYNQQKSIIVSNLNTTPKQMYDSIIRQAAKEAQINQAVGANHADGTAATDTAVMSNNNMQKSKSILKMGVKKSKGKDKNVDDQYKCQSEDDQFLLHSHRSTKRSKPKQSRPAKNKQFNQDQPPKRRGRQGKKIVQMSHNNTSNQGEMFSAEQINSQKNDILEQPVDPSQIQQSVGGYGQNDEQPSEDNEIPEGGIDFGMLD